MSIWSTRDNMMPGGGSDPEPPAVYEQGGHAEGVDARRRGPSLSGHPSAEERKVREATEDEPAGDHRGGRDDVEVADQEQTNDAAETAQRNQKPFRCDGAPSIEARGDRPEAGHDQTRSDSERGELNQKGQLCLAAGMKDEAATVRAAATMPRPKRRRIPLPARRRRGMCRFAM